MEITLKKDNVVKVVDNDEAATKLLSKGFQEVCRDESTGASGLDEIEYNAAIKEVAEKALKERLSEYEELIGKTVDEVTKKAVEKVEDAVASQIETLNVTAEEAKKSLISSEKVVEANPVNNSSNKNGKKATTSVKK